MTEICPVCEIEFSPKIKDQIVCSLSCYLKYHEMAARVRWVQRLIKSKSLKVETAIKVSHKKKLISQLVEKSPNPKVQSNSELQDSGSTEINRFLSECIEFTKNRKDVIKKTDLFKASIAFGLTDNRRNFYSSLPSALKQYIYSRQGIWYYRYIIWTEKGRQLVDQVPNSVVQNSKSKVRKSLDINHDSIDEFRLKEGLQKYNPGVILCRDCEKPFHSFDQTLNKICDQCKNKISREGLDEHSISL